MAKTDYCVIGLGRFGTEVAEQLTNMGKNVMVVDTNQETIQKASKFYDIAVCCDATDINALSESGVKNIGTIIVAISDMESSITIATNLKELGVNDIIARASTVIHKRILKTIGVPRIHIPEIEIASKVAFQALFNVGVDIVSVGYGISWIKSTVSNRDIINKTMAELNFRNKYNATIMMVQRQGEVIFPPTNDTSLQLGDIVTFMCHNHQIANILKLFISETSEE
ncbi:MAG: TrkA family potassium uptake protein [Mycoplasmataceae bacterium]|jgi:trk system potassium uptake protein TrkA|nr:TrkA family potassium uptake protein [Mycoplasmataceae bacterium]